MAERLQLHHETRYTLFVERSQVILDEARRAMPDIRPILGYDPFFDIDTYRQLEDSSLQVSQEEFSRLKHQLNTRTRHNLETALGERFNVELSQVEYRIRNNQIVSPEHDEPFLDIIKRGQRYRQINGSNEVTRETAEVEGFEKLQQIITISDDPVSSKANLNKSEANDTGSELISEFKVIIISPRGNPDSIYQHNFFDIYKRNGDQITMTRYTTTATYDQLKKAADKIDPFNSLPQNPQDADFLKNPLITYQSIKEILALFPPDEGIITREDLKRITAICSQIILDYVNNPSHLTFNALLNFADALGIQRSDLVRGQTSIAADIDIRSIIGYYSTLPVRPVLAGCGPQAILATQSPNRILSLLFPYSVAEFGSYSNLTAGSEKTLNCKCPFCNLRVDATISEGRITCPNCNQSAPYKC